MMSVTDPNAREHSSGKRRSDPPPEASSARPGRLRRTTQFAVAALAVCVLGGAILLFSRPSADSEPGAIKAYFFDESTGETLVRRADELPPLTNSAGQATIVQAYYFTCTTPAEKWLGYLAKFDPAKIDAVRKDLAAQSSGTALIRGLPASYKQSQFVRLPASGSPWVRADSAEAAQIMSTLRCPHGQNHTVFPCPPDDP